MREFTFTDSSGEKYSISFGWREPNTCAVCLYPQKYDTKSLAMCTFTFNTKLIVDDEHLDWAAEFLSDEAQSFINRLIKNKAFW